MPTTATHTLVNIADGSRRTFVDDGADIDVATRAFKPRVRRAIIEQAAQQVIAKGPHAGTPVFWAEKPLAPAFEGDPLARFRVLGPAEKKIMAELVAARERFLDVSKPQAENEATLALKTVTRANTNAAQGAGATKPEGDAKP